MKNINFSCLSFHSVKRLECAWRQLFVFESHVVAASGNGGSTAKPQAGPRTRYGRLASVTLKRIANGRGRKGAVFQRNHNAARLGRFGKFANVANPCISSPQTVNLKQMNAFLHSHRHQVILFRRLGGLQNRSEKKKIKRENMNVSGNEEMKTLTTATTRRTQASTKHNSLRKKS